MEYKGTEVREVTTGGTQAGKGFYFTNGGNKPSAVPSFSMWSGTAQNYHIYSGLAASKLSESANKPFSTNANAADLFCNNGDNSYTTRYTNVRVPFVYEDGYYYLDSDKYAVYLNDVSNATNYGNTYDGATMSIADKPAYTDDNGVSGAGYQPFVKITSSTGSINTTKRNGESVSAYNTKSNQVFGFGMLTDVNFQMTDDGKDANGNPIVFEFCGDDDVWVYVDGTLVLDIGGTHDAITGTVNFASGDVTIDALNYDTVGDKAVCRTGTSTGFGSCSTHTSQTISQTNLYTALNTTLTGFSAQGQHKMTIYYMDRGKGKTNCMIKFNLPQRDTLTVTKDFTQSKTPEGEVSELTAAEQAKYNNVPFGFTLYSGNGAAVANKTYYIYENGAATGRSASTDANGHFTLTNGQTAKFNVNIAESGSSWYVIEDTLDTTAYCTPAYVVNGGNLTGGYTSPAPVKKGSDSRADEYNIVCYNYMNSNIPNPYVHTSQDTIVLDYGLPIRIESADLLANDVSRGDSYELLGLYTAPVEPTETEITHVNSITGDYGVAVYEADGITYTLNKEFKGIETLYYVAKATGKGNVGNEEVEKAYYATGTITIIPATSVYYEEMFAHTEDEFGDSNPADTGFVKFYNGAVKWSVEGNNPVEYQETGYVAKHLNTYGTDGVYLDDNGDSLGTSLSADVTNKAARFDYDFTGTGTAIYSRISTDSAYIKVEVTSEEGDGDLRYIDTRVIGDVATNETLYNIPVYFNNDLDFCQHHVTVTVYKAGTFTTAGGSGKDFYLDGIRVYNPMGDDPTANAAYAWDSEANAAVVNIRQKVMGDANENYDLDDFVSLTDVEANLDIENYGSMGPNWELYLNGSNYSVSFGLLNWDAQNYTIYLGMKAPAGQASVKVNDHVIDLNNTADCYYNISNYVVVSDLTIDDDTVKFGKVKIDGGEGLASLTYIKVVGMDKFDLGIDEDIIVDDDSGEDSNDGNNSARMLRFVPYNYDLMLMDGDSEDDAAFTPDYFDGNLSYNAKSKKATLNVVTSTDVAYITVNGEQIFGKQTSGKSGRGNETTVAANVTKGAVNGTVSAATSIGKVSSGKISLGSRLVFNETFKKIDAGSVIEVVCYNAEGIASETYTFVVK